MSPEQFVAKWRGTALGEKQSYQLHFRDLCKMLEHAEPEGSGIGPNGEPFQFERSLKKSGGGHGFADVYYGGRFAIEYKSPGKDLKAAYHQLLQYRENLNNPPLLAVTDIERWEIHSNFPNTEKQIYGFSHEDIAGDKRVLGWLRDMFFAPERLHPGRNREQVTQEAARAFQLIADNMRQWEAETERIAYFLTKLVFCLFAEDISLLPTVGGHQGIFSHIVEQSRGRPEVFRQYARDLFVAMNVGGNTLMQDIPYFNGTLFRVVVVEELSQEALEALSEAAGLNWEAIEPSIFGTLFERSLDPGKRSQLGAHYTSREDIMLIVEPALMGPLRYEWDTVQLEAGPVRERYEKAGTGRARTMARKQLEGLREGMLRRLREVRVLDPACGSGNFLYVSLQALMDMEKEVINHRYWDGLQMPIPGVHPRQMYGIEVNPIAHALASIVVWIGYIQWRSGNGYQGYFGEPILEELEGNIVCRDAILSGGGYMEVEWPEVDVIVGNPPFLGGQKMRGELGDDYYERLTQHYEGRIPGGADLVCYWYENARAHIAKGKAKRAGLLATNSIRGGLNRQVLERIKETGDIFMAWSDRPWILDGAAVRVSMVGFDNGDDESVRLDGIPVKTIFSNLTADVDITAAISLPENERQSFYAIIKRGPFDIDASVAQAMIAADPKNREVLRPIYNGMDITRRPRNKWIIDFGVKTPIEKAQEYSLPFAHVEKHVKPVRQKVMQAKSRKFWWLHESSAPMFRSALEPIERYIATPAVAKHRVFVWLPKSVHPDHALIVFARDDDYFFGVLHSKVHEVWSLRMGSSLEDRPRYTPTTTFRTFPFPWPPGREDVGSSAYVAISRAARELDEERGAWLNAVGLGAGELRERTLTNLYNGLAVYRGEGGGLVKRAAGDFAPRLDELHRALDEAVCGAYGWEAGILGDEEEILRRLLGLNVGRAAL